MAVFRVSKNSNYTAICNHHLRDMGLSLKAKGLLTVMLSLPENWDYSVSGLVAICKEGRGAVETALRELKDAGYLEVTKLPPSKDNGGRFGYIYDVYETPRNTTISRPQKQGPSIQGMENCEQLSTEEQSTETKQRKESVRFAPPTRDEVEAYAIEKGYSGFPVDRFIAYYESNGWMVGRVKMKSWKAAMANWWSRDKATVQKSGDKEAEAVRDYAEMMKALTGGAKYGRC